MGNTFSRNQPAKRVPDALGAAGQCSEPEHRFQNIAAAPRGSGEFAPRGGEGVTVRRACEPYGHRTQSDFPGPPEGMGPGGGPTAGGIPFPRSSSDRHFDTQPGPARSRDRAGRPGSGHRGRGERQNPHNRPPSGLAGGTGRPGKRHAAAHVYPQGQPRNAAPGHGSARLQHRRRPRRHVPQLRVLGAAPVQARMGRRPGHRHGLGGQRLRHPAVQGTAQSRQGRPLVPQDADHHRPPQQSPEQGNFHRRRAPARRAAPAAPRRCAGKHRRGIPGLPPPARAARLRRPAVRA